jgi:hypothetical protein
MSNDLKFLLSHQSKKYFNESQKELLKIIGINKHKNIHH